MKDPITFVRQGRSRQMRVAGSGDLSLLGEVDTALWVATRAPTATLRADPTMLAFLDRDDDGTLQADDIQHAVEWLMASLKTHEGIDAGHDHISLDALLDDGPDGAALQSAARKILSRLAQTEADTLELAEVQTLRKELEEQGLSEAGLVAATAANDEDTTTLIEDILATIGGKPLPSGEQGVDAEALEAFIAQAAELASWAGEGDSDTIRVFGERTATIAALVSTLDAKIRQHFALLDATSLDPRLGAASLPRQEVLDTVDFTDAAQIVALTAAAPLSKIVPGEALDLTGALNPHHGPSLKKLASMLGEARGETLATMSLEDWEALSSELDPWRQWQSSKPDVAAASIPLARIEAVSAEAEHVVALRALLEESHKAGLVTDEVRTLEKLLLYQRGMLDLINSFVSFPDLYDKESRALFEMGTLVLDGRRLTMAVKVPDRARHVRMSKNSNMYVIYAQISERIGEPLYEVAVPVTTGSSGKIQVGQHGVFEDIEGSEMLATVVEIASNPISLMEAIVAPFKRFGALLVGRIEKWSKDTESGLQKQGMETVEKGAAPPPPPTAAKPPEAKAPEGGGAAGMLAGGGIALAALGSSMAFIVQTFAQMGLKTFLISLLALVVMLLLPVILVAVLKLRRRDLSAILEGSGWGINTRMFLTRSQARTFTFTPPYPDSKQP